MYKRQIIPNSTFNKEILENSNFSDSRICNYVEIGVTYESDLDLALEIMREEALAHPSHVDNLSLIHISLPPIRRKTARLPA